MNQVALDGSNKQRGGGVVNRAVKNGKVLSEEGNKEAISKTKEKRFQAR